MLRISRNHESGFSLVEILVTVTIIGILSAIAVPLYMNYQKDAAIGTLKSDVSSTAQQVSIYKRASEAYPTGTNFTNKARVQSTGNVVTLSLTDLADGTQHACVQGVRTFSASDVVRWNYNMTTNQLSEGVCASAVSLPEEVNS